LAGSDKQNTDVHYRSVNGEGLFNWRLKFPFRYDKTENVVVRKKRTVFALDYEDEKYLPKLYLELWDNDHFSPDSYIGGGGCAF